MGEMRALSKTSRIGFALLMWLALAPLISYFSLSWARNKNSIKLRSDGSSEEPRNPKPRPPAPSVSLDTDTDGIPEAAELQSFTDRESFRHSFTHVAEMQFYRLSDQWNMDQRDCAGLVRFAWREALRRHDRIWLQKMGPGYEPLVSEVSTFQQDRSPLREKLFRTDFGSYKDTDLVERKFSEFADARTLKNFNSKFISRDRQLAQPGDLIFYHQPWVQKFPYHVMIFLGESRIADQGARNWVVYHTGASATDEGTVKKVQLSVLDQHPNRRWRPVESNPNFLGFYRLKILD